MATQITIRKRHAGAKLHFYDVTTTFPGEEPRTWEMVSRHSQRTGDKLFMEGNKNPSAVTIVAFTPEKKLVAIREYRYPLGGYVLALPAGIVDEGQTFEQTATDELYQETGLTLTETRTVRHNCFSSPGLTDEVITYVYGTAQGTLSTQNLQPGEKIEPVLLGLSELYNLRTTDSPISARLAVIVEMLCMVADLTEVTEIIR